MSTLVLDGCAVVTMDGQGSEYASGHVVVTGNVITAVGPGAPPPASLPDGAANSSAANSSAANSSGTIRRIDASGCLATPGLINTHHHLYQWGTRGMAADATLFEWLTQLYPVWARMDAGIVQDLSTAALAWLAKTGCSTTMDHHYVFPRSGGDLLRATVAAARQVGLRFHPTRGSMDLGASAGGLPPDEVVEDRDTILLASKAAIEEFHDASPHSMLRVGLAPCSPFSVTSELLTDAAELARQAGVRLHTHLAETADEDEYCAEHFGCTPVEYLDSLGWLGEDVWLAHGVHLDDAAITRLAVTGTGVAHCPSSNGRLGAGICRTHDLLAGGVRVGLGVDGAASSEENSLIGEVRQAALIARSAGGPRAMSVRQALRLATMGSAQLLGRDQEIGSLEAGKLADIALWRLDTLPHAGIADPVAALVLGARPPLELLLVNGETVVERDQLVTVDEPGVAAQARRASAELAERG
ncbi:MAG TPA: 8-oxoguanine deaminase [Streptosporangiaceae bacterium]|nr:8-oxoguanine deaminase [Streptosporangiaceae bacterium]